MKEEATRGKGDRTFRANYEDSVSGETFAETVVAGSYSEAHRQADARYLVHSHIWLRGVEEVFDGDGPEGLKKLLRF